MATPDVRVRLSAEGVAEVIAALKKVQTEGAKVSAAAAGSAKSASGAFTGFNSVLGSTRGLLAQLGVALSAGAFLGFIKSVGNTAEQVGNLSQRTGQASTEMLALALRAEATGVDVELVAKSMTFLTRRIEAFRDGSAEARAVFDRLGISVADLKGKNSAEQFDLVVRKIAELRDGGAKAVITTEALGKSADKLIPLFNDLASGGLKETAERMAQLGIDAAVLERVQQLDGATDDLAETAKLVGLAFADAMGKDTTGAIDSVTEAVAGQAGTWRALGKIVGFFVKLTIPVIDALDQLGVAFQQFVIGTELVFKSFIPNMRNDFAEVRRLTAEAGKKVVELNTALFLRQSRRRARLFGVFPDEPTRPPRGTADDAGEDLARAREARRKAEIDAERKHWELLAKIQIEAERRAFEAGEISLRQFHERRRQITETAGKIAVGLLERERKAALSGTPEAIKLDAEIARKKIENASELAALDADHAERAKALGKERQQDEIKLLELQGRRHEAALIQIEEEVRAREKRRIAFGMDPEAARLAADNERALLVAQANFNDAQERAGIAQAELERAREQVQRRVEQGQISEIEGERELLALERERLPALRKLAEQMLAFALVLKDPKLIEAAQQLLAGLSEPGVRVDQLAVKMKGLGKEIARAGLDSFTDALANIGAAGNPVLDFLESFIGAVKRLAAEIVALQLFRALGLDRLLDTRLSKGGKVTKKATGGFVSGPGTGTSDSIPARLSAGEYVVRAAAVRQPGVLPHLEAINRMPSFTRDDILQAQQGMRDVRLRSLASFSRSQRSHFAEGGLVGAGRGGERATRLDGTITLVLPEGATATVDASEETRRILRIVQKNPRAFRHAQGL